MILVIGGYGGFGARIVRRLAAEGHAVLVAGRDLAKARAFCAGHANLTPLRLDRDSGLAAALETHRPFAVVDAAGPFQGLALDVPRACIAAGCHYLDIADGRAFVTGIGVLDAAAKAAGVRVIAGASSVPALSGAAIRALADGLDRVSAVEMAISASNKATAGPSVTRAIFSYVGKPVRLWRERRWRSVHGWQDMRRQAFSVPGEPPLGPRLVAIADVPDLDLVPDRLPGRPAVSFRAGTELDVENLAVWGSSWLVRWGWLASLEPLGPFAIRLKALTAGLGTDWSAMIVRLFGVAAGRRVERRWTLIASRGDGPEIPALAVPILLDRIRRGTLAPGARDGGFDLALPEFEAAFARLAIRHAIVEVDLGPCLYARVMGARFASLPPAVRVLHDVLRDGGASGRATVTRGRHVLAWALATLLRFPPDGEHALHVGFTERDGVEVWTRDFSGHRFRSEMSRAGDQIVERFGLLRFTFDLKIVEENTSPRLLMRFARWRVGPLPMPRALVPRIEASEWEADGRFRFDVAILSVIRYRGWLESVE